MYCTLSVPIPTVPIAGLNPGVLCELRAHQVPGVAAELQLFIQERPDSPSRDLQTPGGSGSANTEKRVECKQTSLSLALSRSLSLFRSFSLCLSAHAR